MIVAPRDGAGAWTADFGNLAPGSYTLRAQQSDSAGNVGASTASTFTIAAVSSPPPPAQPVAPGFVVAPAEQRPGSLKVVAACASACEARATLRSRSGRTLASGAHALDGGRSAAFTARLGRAGRKALRGRSRVRARLTVTLSSGGRSVLKASRTVELRRDAGLRRIAKRGLRLWAAATRASSLSARLTLSGKEARRRHLTRARGSDRYALASGKVAAGGTSKPLTIRIVRASRRALAKARAVSGRLELTAGAADGTSRAASMRTTLRR
jgi:hypothetical protein